MKRGAARAGASARRAALVPRARGRLREWEQIAVDAVGSVIEFWGFKRNQGRVWALLYLRERALSAAEIQSELGLSKGAVSMITRELERWSVIERLRDPGGDVWRYRAGERLMDMVARVLEQREARLVARVRGELSEAERRARTDRRATVADLERLRRMRMLADLVERSLRAFLKTAQLDAASVMGVLRAPFGALRRSRSP
jgi:DNA-binding transcriptional regulator GbsR (MarR family)